MAAALFAPIALRGLTLANRIVVSPMCQYNAEDGSANDWHLMHLGQFALGAAGLVMTEATHVSQSAGSPTDASASGPMPTSRRCARVVGFCRQLRRRGARHPARPCRTQGLGPAADRGRPAAQAR